MVSQMHKPVPVVIPYFQAPDALSLTLKVLDRQPNVRAIPFVRDNSEDNILFTKAVNEGLHKFFLSDGYEYILVLNQDALLHESCLEQLILVMSQSPTVGIAAPVALSKNKSVNWAGSAAAFPWGQHVTYDLTALPSHIFNLLGKRRLYALESVDDPGAWFA